MKENFKIFLKKNEKTIGIIASVLAILMFVSLIEILLSNIRGDSKILIQPAFTAVNGLFWSLYAYSRKDWPLLIPNILACLLGLFTALSALI